MKLPSKGRIDGIITRVFQIIEIQIICCFTDMDTLEMDDFNFALVLASSLLFLSACGSSTDSGEDFEWLLPLNQADSQRMSAVNRLSRFHALHGVKRQASASPNAGAERCSSIGNYHCLC